MKTVDEIASNHRREDDTVDLDAAVTEMVEILKGANVSLTGVENLALLERYVDACLRKLGELWVTLAHELDALPEGPEVEMANIDSILRFYKIGGLYTYIASKQKAATGLIVAQSVPPQGL